MDILASRQSARSSAAASAKSGSQSSTRGSRRWGCPPRTTGGIATLRRYGTVAATPASGSASNVAIQYATGIENIRDVIPVPSRTPAGRVPDGLGARRRARLRRRPRSAIARALRTTPAGSLTPPAVTTECPRPRARRPQVRLASRLPRPSARRAALGSRSTSTPKRRPPRWFAGRPPHVVQPRATSDAPRTHSGAEELAVATGAAWSRSTRCSRATIVQRGSAPTSGSRPRACAAAPTSNLRTVSMLIDDELTQARPPWVREGRPAGAGRRLGRRPPARRDHDLRDRRRRDSPPPWV